MKKALVLAGGLPQIELILELKKRGYYVVLADYTEHPVAENAADRFYRESTLNVEMIRKIAVDEAVDMLITCCTDQALATVSALSQELNLPCYINKKTGRAVTNKKYMKELLTRYGIPTAKFQIFDRPQSDIALPFPVIVKPVDCNSSKGVEKVFDSAQLEAAVAKAVSYSRTKEAIVEEYIDGREISVDIFVQNGKAEVLCASESEKVFNEHTFVIYKGQYPAQISEAVYADIEKIAQRIADVFELRNSPMLLQVLVRDEDVYVIEFSARTGGCVKYRMIELASGVNVIKSVVDLFEGRPIRICPRRFSGYIIDEFIYCNEGVFDHLEGADLCINNNWVKEIYTLKMPGECIGGVKSSGDRIAALVYAADTYEEYVAGHNNVVNNIKVIDHNGQDIMRHDLLPKL